jgi:hypothetical protein
LRLYASETKLRLAESGYIPITGRVLPFNSGIADGTEKGWRISEKREILPCA